MRIGRRAGGAPTRCATRAGNPLQPSAGPARIDGTSGRSGEPAQWPEPGSHLLEHERLDIAEVMTPVHEPWHGRAAGVEHEADTRGTEVEK